MKASTKNKSRPALAPLESHLGYWLRYVSNHVSHAFGKRLGKLGVTTAEWVVLRQAYDHETTSVGGLAAMTGLTRGAISKLVDRLADKHLLAKTGVAHDKRRQEVRLTARGFQLLPKLVASADANDRFFFAHLSIADRQRLLHVMRELVRIHQLRLTPTE